MAPMNLSCIYEAHALCCLSTSPILKYLAPYFQTPENNFSLYICCLEFQRF